MIDSSEKQQAPIFMPATEADIDALVALVNSAYRGEESRQGWTTEASFLGGQRIDREAMGDLIGTPDQTVLLLRDFIGIKACAHLKRLTPDLVYLGMLSVRPTAQGERTGRVLMLKCEEYARVHFGAQRIEMTVIDIRHELIAWYERRGYRQTAETRPFPYCNERFGVPLRDDLQFLVMAKTLQVG
jgi:GNAT superfamily N-acetyltransferase